MNYGFVIDNRKCIGCHACTAACRAEHGTANGFSRTWIEPIAENGPVNGGGQFSLRRCRHCGQAPCVAICPVPALFRRDDGIVALDEAACIGCRACLPACPYDALHMDPATGSASKCDFCTHRLEQGQPLPCTAACPVDALSWIDLDDGGGERNRFQEFQQTQPFQTHPGTAPKLFTLGGNSLPEGPAGTANDLSIREHGEAARRSFGHRIPLRPPRKTPWDWEFTVLGWSRSVAAGLLLAPLTLELAGMLSLRLRYAALLGLAALLLLGLSMLLQFRQATHSRRLWRNLSRLRWGSWIVRYSALVLALALGIVLWMGGMVLLGADPAWLRTALVLLATGVALGPAFLLRQAAGRVLWRHPLLPWRIAVAALMSGSALALVLGLGGNFGLQFPLVTLLSAAIALHLGLTAGLIFRPGKNREAVATLSTIRQGSLWIPFWGAVGLGNVLPLVLLLFSRSGLSVLPAVLLVLLFALVTDHVWLRAPQLDAA